MAREFMPIMRHPEFKLPWALIAPHARQAMTNHGQTLERIAERSGLSFSEALAILLDVPWEQIGTHGGEEGCRASIEHLIHRATASGAAATDGTTKGDA